MFFISVYPRVQADSGTSGKLQTVGVNLYKRLTGRIYMNTLKQLPDAKGTVIVLSKTDLHVTQQQVNNALLHNLFKCEPTIKASILHETDAVILRQHKTMIVVIISAHVMFYKL